MVPKPARRSGRLTEMVPAVPFAAWCGEVPEAEAVAVELDVETAWALDATVGWVVELDGV